MGGVIRFIIGARGGLLALGLVLAAAPWALPGTAWLDSRAFQGASLIRSAPPPATLPLLMTLPRELTAGPGRPEILIDHISRTAAHLRQGGARRLGVLLDRNTAAGLAWTMPEALEALAANGIVIGAPVPGSRTAAGGFPRPGHGGSAGFSERLYTGMGTPYETPTLSAEIPWLPLTEYPETHAARARWWYSGSDETGSMPLPDFTTALLDSPASSARHWYPHWSLASGRLPPLSLVQTDMYLNDPASTGVRDQVVLIGIAGDPALRDTAGVIASGLNQAQSESPGWAGPVAAAATLLVATYLVLAVPAVKVLTGLVLTLFVLLLFTWFQLGIFLARNEWLLLTVPATYLGLGHLLVLPAAVDHRRRRRERKRLDVSRLQLACMQFERGDSDTALATVADNRTSQELLDLFYRIALGFEKRRQYGRARDTLNSISRRQKGYGDVTRRLELLDQLGDQPSGATSLAGTLVMPGPGLEQPDIGRYRIERELGRGGMGVVYLALDPRINRQVAIKALDLSVLDATEADQFKQRFIREAEAAGRLSHPGIVTIYDVGEDGDLAYIAMDYVPGEPLNHRSEPDRLLAVSDVYDLVAQAAEALDYAHEKGIVHRDIKPANLIHDPQTGRLKITDFGVARVADAGRTRTGAIIGSPAYMAPEQIAGGKVDGRTDIFALGVTLYQLLTGDFPFQGDTLAALAHQISRGQPEPIRNVRPDLPASATRIINRALKKSPDGRYGRAGELAEALRKARA